MVFFFLIYQQDLDHKWNDYLANLFAFVIVPLKIKVFTASFCNSWSLFHIEYTFSNG